MNKKMRKFCYAYSENCRSRTKDLGRELGISQQSASYLIASTVRKKLIHSYVTVVDPSKCGLITLLAYYNFADFTSKRIQEMLAFLRHTEQVVYVEQLQQGYDLLCRFCVPNLSQFNKLNRDFLQAFRGDIFHAETYPVVADHLYPKKYLIPPYHNEEMIICGDRDPLVLSDHEQHVLELLCRAPQLPVVELARTLSINPKTVIKIKTKLEQHNIIRKYSTVWNYPLAGLRRYQLFFNSNDILLKDDLRFLEFCKLHPHIVQFTRLIGKYDLCIGVEGENLSRRNALKELRSEFPFRLYAFVEQGNIIKETCIPLPEKGATFLNRPPIEYRNGQSRKKAGKQDKNQKENLA